MPHSVHTRILMALSRSLEATVGDFCIAFQGHLEALQNDRNCMLACPTCFLLIQSIEDARRNFMARLLSLARQQDMFRDDGLRLGEV